MAGRSMVGEGADVKSRRQVVLFADPEHGPRAQMAEAMLRALDRRGEYHASSAGSDPVADLTGVSEVLTELGIDFRPARCALQLDMAPDLLVVVCEEGCAACPWLPRAARVERWPLDDPTGMTGDARRDALRAIRQRLTVRIRLLLEPNVIPMA